MPKYFVFLVGYTTPDGEYREDVFDRWVGVYEARSPEEAAQKAARDLRHAEDGLPRYLWGTARAAGSVDGFTAPPFEYEEIKGREDWTYVQVPKKGAGPDGEDVVLDLAVLPA